MVNSQTEFYFSQHRETMVDDYDSYDPKFSSTAYQDVRQDLTVCFGLTSMKMKGMVKWSASVVIEEIL